MEYGLKKDIEGFYFQTEKAKYRLLEGLTIGVEKRYSSDILFIMDDEDVERPAQVVGFLYGEFQLEEEDNSDYVELIESLITKYEKEN
jgi:hypothetical protein